MKQPARISASRLVLALAMALLAACVTIPSREPAPKTTDLKMLEPGTPRKTVVEMLGAANRVLATDGVEIYSVSSIEGYQAGLMIAPVFPGVAPNVSMIGEQFFHVLARYDAEGSLLRLAWERGAPLRGHSAGIPPHIVPRESSEPESHGNAHAERLTSWTGQRILVSNTGRRGLLMTLSWPYHVPTVPYLKTAQLLDLERSTPLGPIVSPPTFRRSTGGIGTVAAVLDDGRAASLCNDFTLCLWEAVSGRVVTSVTLAYRGSFFLDGRNAPVAIAPAPDGAPIAVTDRFDNLALFDVPSLSAIPLRTLGGLAIPAWAGNTLVVAERVGMDRVRFTDGTSGRILLETAHQMRGVSLTEQGMPPVGQFFGVELYSWMALHADPAEGFFALSQNGLRLALNRRSHVELYTRADRASAFTLEQVMLLPPNYDEQRLVPVGTIGFSADGERLAAGFGTLLVWDLATGREILRLVPEDGGRAPDGAGGLIDLAHGFHLLPDGRRFVTADGLYAIVEPTAVALAREPVAP